MKRAAAVACLLAGGWACRGMGDSASPTHPDLREAVASPVLLSIVSGETLEPVRGVRVVVDGNAYTTDAGGQVVLAAPTSGGLEAGAEGFFLRRTLARSGRLSLWPTASPTGIDVEFTARLVYNCPAADCPSGGEPLLRVAERDVFVVPSEPIRDDALAWASHETAADRLTAATLGAVRFTAVASAPASAIVVSTLVDPADPDLLALRAAAVARRRFTDGAAIAGATIVFRSLDLARRAPLVMHELGHAFGLGHSPRTGDVMWNGPELYAARDYSPREKLAMDLMLQRGAGNHFPDSDASLGMGARGTVRASSLVACGF